MTTAVDTSTVSVSVDYACCGHDLAADLHAQLSTGAYDRCSAMPLPHSISEWRAEHRTARKRADRACRRGYAAGPLKREHYQDDMYEIRTSADTRQGRPMSAAYRVRQEYETLPDYACERHAARTTGVWEPGGHLVAYLVMIRAGNLALVSEIMGHAEHLEYEIMYLLFQASLEREPAPGFAIYNRHDSGTDGLRFFKERLGFAAADVEWLL